MHLAAIFLPMVVLAGALPANLPTWPTGRARLIRLNTYPLFERAGDRMDEELERDFRRINETLDALSEGQRLKLRPSAWF
ncbi:hypothetical protein EVJ50_06730 [Synechococcus sp. RSCCF101]|nr:hypothetical protein EVJ50_06730 [Synechococcus sp. RSCCF101]